ncbi:DUF222 domain-containing protein [Mycolicibacterium sp. 120270]|uniref:DUF222 domain-containing protein n=1 Tax=Mycolicibacterium sp. 120270 TaxID=3090600 RepID=UPI00299EFCD8|nr:DUF222 domain-containing protein [Mycolicibacterium sp. 120270]MDX1882424.1 DUF222 domain-containing protein [Mycolicibacterium sp. 120270]
MSTKEDIVAALDAVDVAHRRLLALPLHTLTRSERIELLKKIDELGRRLVAFDRRLIGRLITEAAPAQFGGASWPDVLARRLRISRAEAERRVAAAVYSTDADRPSA